MTTDNTIYTAIPDTKESSNLKVARAAQWEACIWNESLRKLGAEYKYFEWTYLRAVLLYFPVI